MKKLFDKDLYRTFYFLQSVTVSELDRLLGLVVDVENLFMCVHKEEDGDTKQVYYFLFKLLRKSILQASKPTVEGPLVRWLSLLIVVSCVFLLQKVALMLRFEHLAGFCVCFLQNFICEMKYFN